MNTIEIRDNVLLHWLTALFLLCLSTVAFAETVDASAENQVGEVAIANQIIRQQQHQTQSGNTSQVAPNPDMSLGQNITQEDTVSEVKALPPFNQPVIDQANILTAEQNTQLTQSIRQIYDAGKAQIAIVIVPTTGQQDIFSYSLAIAEKWQLGTARHDNGLLIVVAVNDRRIQILTGYGLEGILPDIVTHQIIQRQITPYFKQNQYAQGLQAGVNEIDRILGLDPDIARQAAESLKERQAEAHRKQQAQQNTLGLSLFILGAAVFASYLIGRKLSAFGAGVAGTALGLVNGLGLGASLILGFGLFILIISSLAQLIMQGIASSSGRGGHGGGGFGGGGFGGGGYSGGGGSFGGGGASGSW